MKKALVFLLMATTLFAFEFSGDKVIAVVGDSAVLYSDVDAYTDMKMQQYGGDLLIRNILFEQSLEELINSRILVAHANADTNIKVSDFDVSEQVNTRINQILAQNKFTREQLTAILKEQENMTLTEFREQLGIQIRQEMIRQQVMQHYIVERDLSREEVREFFNSFKDSLPPMGESIRLQKIEIQTKSDSLERQKAYDAITFVRRQIVDRGEKFEDMAKKYSKAPNAENDGGDLGFIAKGTLSLVRLEAAAFSLEPGEVSAPIETRIGWHLIKVSERTGEGVRAHHIFIPVNASETKIAEAMKIIDSVANSNPTEAQFIKAVEKYGTDNIAKAYKGDVGWELLSAVDEQIRNSFRTISVGAISQPIRKENTFFLYRISDYDQDRPMDFESDYDEISKYASMLQSQERLRDLILRWRNDVFVKIYQ
ncbi:MAG: peptidylprolyl isomerase [Chitinivibrionia bacterium]|nr:peptidylprolyl isomerase [Chitinivibrionia bacterium]